MLQAILVVVILGLIGVDQLTKCLAVTYLKGTPSVDLIPRIFGLTYRENTGAAWGILDNMRWLLILVPAVIMVFLLVVLLMGKYRMYKLMNISLVLVIAGGIGNLVDRIFRGYVVDFLHFKAIDFPVFNVADCCVVIGASLLLIFFFFIYNEDRHKQLLSAASSATETTSGEAAPAEAAGEGDHDSNPSDGSAGEPR